MERSSFVRDGVVRLPPGFRFHPTDEELVVQYLRRKVLAFPLPAAVIPEINLAKLDPWDLPGESEGERYFFSLGETTRRSTRTTRSGYWKAAGRAKPVVAEASNELVGMKKVLVFHQGKPGPRGRRTDWVMHEYCLAAAAVCNNSTTSSSAQRKISINRKDWVVCRMFKKRATAWSRSTRLVNHSEFIGSPVSSGSSSSSSSSSCVTCLSEEEGDEGSSSSNGIASTNSHGKVP